MLIKMKLPEKYPHSHSCEYWHGFTCDCEAGTQHNCLAEIEELNQPLVRGMEIDVEELTRLIRIQNKDTTDANDKALAVYLKANAHVWLKEVEKGK